MKSVHPCPGVRRRANTAVAGCARKHAEEFVPLIGERSPFQQTLQRVADRLFARPIVANAEFRFVVAEQLRELGIAADIVLEPARRDSGAAVAVALAAQRERSQPCWCSAADHIMRKPEEFLAACREAATAAAAAAAGRIVCGSPSAGWQQAVDSTHSCDTS